MLTMFNIQCWLFDIVHYIVFWITMYKWIKVQQDDEANEGRFYYCVFVELCPSRVVSS